MNWRPFNTRSSKAAKKDRFATAQEMQVTFNAEYTNLYWIAFVIIGDPLLAQKSVIDASGLQKTSSTIFRDWLIRWAHSATAREAARNVRELSRTSVPRYSTWVCGHTDHGLLSIEQVAALRQLDPLEIVVNLDHLARSVLVLRGTQNASVSDCSMLIDVPRSAVTGAYCHAVEWFQKYTLSKQHENSALAATHCDTAEAPR